MSDKACGTCQYWALDGDLGVCPWDVMAGAPCYWWHKGHPCGNGLYAPYPPPEMARYRDALERIAKYIRPGGIFFVETILQLKEIARAALKGESDAGTDE